MNAFQGANGTNAAGSIFNNVGGDQIISNYAGASLGFDIFYVLK
jgi:hypothetical protein